MTTPEPAPEGPAARHRAAASRFGDLINGAPDLDVPSPVEGWTARDVVIHLIDWLPGFLSGGAGIDLPEGPDPTTDPAGAWGARTAAIQGLLDDPRSAGHVVRNPHLGEVPLPDALDRFYTADVFMHTWDLARATGQDDRLDPTTCSAMLAGMEPMDEVLRSSGQYGPRVPVPDDADVQDRLIGFIGRDPSWTPPGASPG